MPIVNPSFEDAGLLPGEAAGWTLQASASRELLAGFGTAPEDAVEAFERWFVWLGSLADVPTARAFLDGAAEGYEDFDGGWQNSGFLLEFPPAQLVVCAFGGRPAEDCEVGWAGESYAHTWDQVVAVDGLFGGETGEGFERSWRDNDHFLSSWSDVTSSIARFDASTRDAETFEDTWSWATSQ